VTPHIKLGSKKVNIKLLGSGKWVFSSMFAEFAEAGKKPSTVVHLLEKSVINMI
jgi:hypothetical protein